MSASYPSSRFQNYAAPVIVRSMTPIVSPRTAWARTLNTQADPSLPMLPSTFNPHNLPAPVGSRAATESHARRLPVRFASSPSSFGSPSSHPYAGNAKTHEQAPGLPPPKDIFRSDESHADLDKSFTLAYGANHQETNGNGLLIASPTQDKLAHLQPHRGSSSSQPYTDAHLVRAKSPSSAGASFPADTIMYGDERVSPATTQGDTFRCPQCSK
ncbi:hypothetical protein BC831DRAFT_451007, partial [Entophlyctis helioformis]